MISKFKAVGQLVGYARVSSHGQSLDGQVAKLKEMGCATIFEEKRSGKRADNRPELKNCLNFVRKGDVLVVCKLDRLARSVRDLHNISRALEEKHVELKVLEQEFDTTTAPGRLMFSVLGAIAEFENDLRRERQMDGIERAKAKGVRFGPKKRLSAEQIENLKADYVKCKKSKAALAKEYGISRATLYRLIN